MFVVAGIYNAGWGLYAALDPPWLFRFGGMVPLNHPQIFACLGMVVGLYGLIYLEVARAPEKGWPLRRLGYSESCSGLPGGPTSSWAEPGPSPP